MAKKTKAVGPTKAQSEAEAKRRAARPKTGEGTHIATQRGYAAGELIEEGQDVPAGIAISDNWMTKTAD